MFGKCGLVWIVLLVEIINLFRMFKQRIDLFDLSEFDLLEVVCYVDLIELIQGKCFVKLWVDKENGVCIFYYYFVYCQELNCILLLFNLFINDFY